MPQIKLDRFSILEIKELLQDSELNTSQIAEKFNISRRHVDHIKKGDRWKECFICEQEKNKYYKYKIDVQLQETTNSNSNTPSYRISI